MSNQSVEDPTPGDARDAVVKYCSVATMGSSWKSTLQRGMADTPTHLMLLAGTRG
jgi:hypothetical protein